MCVCVVRMHCTALHCIACVCEPLATSELPDMQPLRRNARALRDVLVPAARPQTCQLKTSKFSLDVDFEFRLELASVNNVACLNSNFLIHTSTPARDVDRYVITARVSVKPSESRRRQRCTADCNYTCSHPHRDALVGSTGMGAGSGVENEFKHGTWATISRERRPQRRRG